MRFLSCVLIALFCFHLSGCANTKLNANKLPKGVVLNKAITLPVDVSVAYYLPHSQLNNRFYLEKWNIWVDPGKSLSDGVKDGFGAYFSNAKLLDRTQASQYGLLIDIDPEWKFESGKAEMIMSYRVFNGSDKPIREGQKSFKADIGYLGDGLGLYNAALRATQLVIVDVLNTLTPSASSYPAQYAMKDVSANLLANMQKPVSTGTGFYINPQGQIVTAAHVLKNCMVTQVNVGGKSFDAAVEASSTLLDLAVVSTGTPVEQYLPLRKGTEIFLGEAITNVGYPLQGLLAASPNLTRGNISSREALKGAVGQFQFSAPIQPGSSGGPVVSDGGELLGITVSTLNVTSLRESGALPQNVNFALDAKYAARFLDKHRISYQSVEPNMKGDIRTANAAALGAVVQLNCYQ
ncbi:MULTISPECIES: S1 family peptidase [Shewanella]|jgi:S1-C subfamily serine protease|uniref:Serine protease n=1 Tax=Shewanella xiamenensis TaxID=332186 RepID=A0AAE4Q170_9GAMM|nr:MULTISPECIES: serine protease [Shewanella]ASF16709.1 serine protease [Shewanella sp. FDAARGOS_354]KEK26831.1 peptidase S1 and S6, chymotrypsin/Hap [Shewanella xiamenensis]MBW0279824.1 peptidase S1 [Shewanella xiamenensis]MBW0296482.1 peptidase S1 [Shewanella xiamenensis]MCH7421933.1 serine protease [Shewanella sp. MM_2022_3]